MILASLTLESYRNLTDQKLSFSREANIISGNNGQGKTNLLEAIFLLASTRSFRTPQIRDVIQWGAAGFRLEGEVETRQRGYCLDVQQLERSKKLRINQTPRDIFDYIGHLSVQVFSSNQLERFRSEAEQRRKFVDRGLYLLQPLHLRRMAEYSRVLKQKNSLLKDSSSIYNKTFGNLLEVWDQKIAELGARIITSRSEYVERVRQNLSALSGSLVPESVNIHYHPCNEISSANDVQSVQFQLIAKINAHREKEIRLKRSLVGPHRDEIMIFVNGVEMQRFSSAGQQRSALLACHLAQMELHNSQHGEYPVFLIDDVDSELDDERMNRVVELLRRKTQVFMTTSRPDRIRLDEQSISAKWFHLESGTVTEAGISRILHLGRG
jgi:DNA replication and repair protein RecF